MAAETEIEQYRSNRDMQYLFVAYVVVSRDFDIIEEIADSDTGIPCGLPRMRP